MINDTYTLSAGLYLFTFMVFAILAHCLLKPELINQQGNRKKLVYLVIFLPTLIAGLRYGIGTDYNLTYIKCFNTSLSSNYYGNKYEYIFYFLNVVVHSLGGSVNVVLYISSIITLGMFILGSLYYRNNISISVCAFVYMLLTFNNSLNNVRQCAAVAIVFFGMKYCYEKKMLKYTICVLMAMGFHISAICMWPLYFVFSKLNDRNMVTTDSKGISKTKSRLIKLLLIILVVVSQFSLSSLDRVGLSYYVPYFTRLQFTSTINWMSMLRYFPWILGICYVFHKFRMNYKAFIVCVFSLIGVVIELIAMNMTVGAFEQVHRIANYFTIYLPILAGMIASGAKSSTTIHSIKVNFALLISFMLILTSIITWNNDVVKKNANETLPYVTVFSENNQVQ